MVKSTQWPICDVSLLFRGFLQLTITFLFLGRFTPNKKQNHLHMILRHMTWARTHTKVQSFRLCINATQWRVFQTSSKNVSKTAKYLSVGKSDFWRHDVTSWCDVMMWRHDVTSWGIPAGSLSENWFSVRKLVLCPNAGSLSKNWFSVTFFEWTSSFQTLVLCPNAGSLSKTYFQGFKNVIDYNFVNSEPIWTNKLPFNS